MSRHPSTNALSRYSHGTLKPWRLGAIERHVSSCSSCQAEIAAIEGISDRLTSLPELRAPKGLIGRIETTWEGGPAGTPGAPPHGLHDDGGTLRDWYRRARYNGPFGVIAAALATIAIVATLLLVTRGVSAGASSLTIEIAEGSASDLRVDIVTASHLASEDSVRVRAETWPRRFGVDGPFDPVLVESTAPRAKGSTFRTRFQIADRISYGRFVVEDLTGQRLDTNGGLFWEYLEHDATGQPTLSSLVQRFFANEQDNPDRALETAQLLTARFPAEPVSWVLMTFTDLRGGRDPSVNPLYERRLLAMDQHYREVEASLDQIGMLLQLSKVLRDSARTTRWLDRLDTLPNRRWASTHQLQEMRRLATPVDSQLDWLEEAWERDRNPRLLGRAFQLARQSADSNAIRRWGDRYLEAAPERAEFILLEFGKVPNLRDHAAERARESLRAIELLGPAPRGLTETSLAFATRGNRVRNAYLMTIGRLLLRQGSRQAGLDTLALATATGWNPQHYVEVGSERLVNEDSAGAEQMFDFVQADPVNGPAFTTDIPVAFRWTNDDEARREAASDSMASRVRLQTNPQLIGEPLFAHSADGTVHDLREELRGSAAIVIYWVAGTLFEVENTERRLSNMRELIENSGVRVVVLTRPGVRLAAEAQEAASNANLTVYSADNAAAPRLLGIVRDDQWIAVADGRWIHEWNNSVDVRPVILASLLLLNERSR